MLRYGFFRIWCMGFNERVLLKHLCILLIGVWLVWNWFARRLRILMYLYRRSASRLCYSGLSLEFR